MGLLFKVLNKANSRVNDIGFDCHSSATRLCHSKCQYEEKYRKMKN